MLIHTYTNMHPSGSGPNAILFVMATLFPVLHLSNADQDKLSRFKKKDRKRKGKEEGLKR